jgi:hypothetical protein
MNVFLDWFSSSRYASGGTFRVIRGVEGKDVALYSAHAEEEEEPVRQHLNLLI